MIAASGSPPEHRFLADALLDVYGRAGVELSLMLRGAEGFGVRHHVRTDRLLTLSEDLPLVSIAVDARARIEGLLDDVLAVKRHGLITLERARMLTGSLGPVALAEQVHEATKLTIYAPAIPRRLAAQEVADRHERRHALGALLTAHVSAGPPQLLSVGALLRSVPAVGAVGREAACLGPAISGSGRP
jgi:PII-like signaling protein